MTSPLQEAIAKAICGVYGLPLDPSPGEIDGELAARYAGVKGLTEVVLGVLRADDDTRYVAITKQQRNALGSVCSARGNPSHAMRDAAWSIASAYDAVAPNAKDQT